MRFLKGVFTIAVATLAEGNKLQQTAKELAAKFKTLGASVSPKGA